MAEVEITRKGGVQTLTLQRAEKKNALTQSMYAALADAIEDGDASNDVSAHVLLGSGGIFTAGNDIGDFLAQAKSRSANHDVNETAVLRFVRLLPRIKKPLLAGVDGPAIGIGTTLLFHCDLIYATPTAQFATPFLDLGLVPEAGATILMPQRLGHSRAFEMLALGATFSAEHMRDVGLLNAIVDPGSLADHVHTAACTLAAKPPEALSLTRTMLLPNREALVARIDDEIIAFQKRMQSPEALEAFQAFLEKRPPDFSKVAKSG